jgi:hypothetical protein
MSEVRYEFFVEMKVCGRPETTCLGRVTANSAIGTAVGIAFASMKPSEKEGMHIGQCAAALLAMAGDASSYPVKKRIGTAEMSLNIRRAS